MATKEELREEAELNFIQPSQVIGIAQEYDEEEGDREKYSENEVEYEAMGNSQEGEAKEAIDGRNSENASKSKPKKYQNPLCKPVYSAGNKTLGMSEARLYGLLDADGNIDLGAIKSRACPPKHVASPEVMGALSKPREAAPNDFEEERLAAEEEERKQALMMSNAAKTKCGYDWVDRLKSRGDFLNHAFSENSKSNNEAEKEAYDARLDKLCCPVCKKPQTYDQFIEKKRECTQCHEKFTKLNVSHAANFAKKVQEREKAKAEKLAKLEAELYPPVKTPAARPAPSNLRPKSAVASGAISATSSVTGKSNSASSTTKLPKNSQESVLEKIAERQSAASERLKALMKVANASNTDNSVGETVSGKPPANRKSVAKVPTSNNVSSKFEKLVET